MDENISKYKVTDRELARGRNLKIATWTAPFILTGVPAVLFLVLTLIFGSTPPIAFTLFFFGMIITAVGFLAGISASAFFGYRRSNWTKEMREKIAADGIRAEEIEWFRHELKTNEKRVLKEMSGSDLLLADAYRETLASRLTATRIVKSSKKELVLTQRRKQRLKSLKSSKADDFRSQIDQDAEKVASINEEAKLMLIEAEARLQMIEAAATRGSSLADSELALKKLSARSQALPLALEEARMTDEIKRELDADLADDPNPEEIGNTSETN
jgi:hypothetical protein